MNIRSLKQYIHSLGLKADNIAPSQGVSDKTLVDSQQMLGFELPTQYCTFLKEYNGIHLFPNHFSFRNTDNHIGKENISYFISIEEVLESWKHIKTCLFTKHLLPIAFTLGGGKYIGIGIVEENKGCIYLVESDFSYTMIAHSFLEFVSKIIYEET